MLYLNPLSGIFQITCYLIFLILLIKKHCVVEPPAIQATRSCQQKSSFPPQHTHTHTHISRSRTDSANIFKRWVSFSFPYEFYLLRVWGVWMAQRKPSLLQVFTPNTLLLILSIWELEDFQFQHRGNHLPELVFTPTST